MKYDKRTIRMIQDSFREAREAMQKSLHDLMKELQGHTHGRLCFGFRHCRKTEGRIVEIKKKIKEFREAEAGLAKGKYSKAIEILGRTSERIDVRVPTRVADNPPKTLDASAAIAYGMEQARNYLSNLQPSYQG